MAYSLLLTRLRKFSRNFEFDTVRILRPCKMTTSGSSINNRSINQSINNQSINQSCTGSKIEYSRIVPIQGWLICGRNDRKIFRKFLTLKFSALFSRWSILIGVGAYFEWGGTRFWGPPISIIGQGLLYRSPWIGAQKRAAQSWILGPIYSFIGA